MSLSNNFIKPIRGKVFLVPEVTFGTAVFPSAGDAIVLEGDMAFPSQPSEHTEANEILNTRSITALSLNLRKAGSLSFSTLCRPSGSAGTAPQEGPLLQALLGDETVTPATSVVYDPNVAKTSQTLWMQCVDGVLFCKGAVVHSLKVSRMGDGFFKMDWGVMFAELGRGGETTTNGALIGGESSITVHDSEQFSVGAKIDVGSSTGHVITSINFTTHAIGVSPVISGAQGDGSDVVASDLPTPTVVGAPTDVRPIIDINGTDIAWKSGEISIEEEIAFIEDEVPADPTTAEFPTGFTAKRRKISANVVIVARTSDMGKLRASRADETLQFDLATNAAAGSKLDISLPQGRRNVAELSAGDAAAEMTISYVVNASSSLEDEITFTYT